MRTPPPPVFLLGSMFSVQFGSAFADKLFAQAGPAGTVLMRLGLSALILIVAVRPRLRGRTRADLYAVAAYGLVLGTMNWTFYEALHRLPLGVAVTIEFTGPLVVAAVGSRRLLDGLWVLLAAAGVLLLAFGGSHHGVTTAGVLLALGAGACWAGYILTSKRVGTTFSTMDGLSIALCFGTLVALPAGIVEGGSALGRPSVLLGGLAVAVLSSIVPYSLELTALRRISGATFGLLMSLSPAVAALAGVVTLGQHLSTVLLVALALVVVASIGTTLSSRSGVAAAVGADLPVP
ncbi:EamA family transporter [Jatrophihabitans sp.]|uniref:EamA family transporter n=1 Tax=Jatrophihabitans sp. TaxID=1932789 RepID=UPI0030C65B25|nr:putative permease, superfamily [Jatrophihabitans sp.]